MSNRSAALTTLSANGETPAFNIDGGSVEVQGQVAGVGAVAAAVALYATNNPSDATSFVLVGALNLAGTTLAVASKRLSTSLAVGKLVVSGLTGTNASATVSAGMSAGTGDMTASGPFTVQGQAGAVGVPVGATANPSATFSRPADTTAYASGDLVANNTVAGSVAPMQFTLARAAAGSGSVTKARLRKSGTSVANASFQLHLFSAAPVVSAGDNAALATTGSASYLGSISFSAPLTNGAGTNPFSDGASITGVPTLGNALSVALGTGQVIYGLLEARGAYTPTSGETFAVTLEVLQD